MSGAHAAVTLSQPLQTNEKSNVQVHFCRLSRVSSFHLGSSLSDLASYFRQALKISWFFLNESLSRRVNSIFWTFWTLSKMSKVEDFRKSKKIAELRTS
jgi:hypothetical protein